MEKFVIFPQEWKEEEEISCCLLFLKTLGGRTLMEIEHLTPGSGEQGGQVQFVTSFPTAAWALL